jgi:hypothetical protein
MFVTTNILQIPSKFTLDQKEEGGGGGTVIAQLIFKPRR